MIVIYKLHPRLSVGSNLVAGGTVKTQSPAGYSDALLGAGLLVRGLVL